MSTIANDIFSETVNTALSAHTPAPTGTSWTLEAAQFTVIGATDRCQHNRSTTDRAREGTSIGDDDMAVSADVAVASAVTRLAGVCGRMSTDNYTNQFEAYLQFLNATTQQVYLYKHVGGVRTQIGNSPQNVTLAANTFCTLKLTITSGAQEVFINGVSTVTASEADSTLSGRTYAGIIMNGNNSSNANMDNYLSESVSGTTPLTATDTTAVGLTDSDAAILILTLKSAAETLAVALTEPLPTIALTSITKAATDTLTVQLSPESATATPVADTVPKAATDTVTVRLSTEAATIGITKVFTATDTLVVRASTETTVLVKSTIAAVLPTQVAPVWRLTSGNTALLPHLASRDVEL